MKNQNIVILLIAIATCSVCKSQSLDIDKISFFYDGSLRIPFNKVNIEIYKRDDGKSAYANVNSQSANDDRRWQYSVKNTFYDVEINEFDNLAMKIALLEKIDFGIAHQEGADGQTCKLEFSSRGHGISYEFWSPESETKERGLEVFLETCEQILRLAKLNPKEIIED